MKKLNIQIRPSCDYGIFHDSRSDVRQLAVALNMCIDKINEIIVEVEKLKKEG